MSKLLLLLVAVLVFFWLLRRALSSRKPGAGPAGPSPQPAPKLVACEHCGVLLPQSEAIALDNPGPPAVRRFFCTEEHVRLGSR